MILIDDRIGSVDLHPLIPGSKLKRLAFGDACFSGQSHQFPGDICRVGVERKRITDLIQSFLTGRLSGHQLPGLAASFHYIVLIIEGEWRAGAEGQVEIPWGPVWKAVPGRGATYASIRHYLMTLDYVVGVRVVETRDARHTAQYIRLLHNWFQQARHGSHEAFDTSRGEAAARSVISTRRPSPVRLVAKEIPGVGWERSKEADRKWTTVERMMRASAKEWGELPGFGPKLAKVAHGWFRGEEGKE